MYMYAYIYVYYIYRYICCVAGTAGVQLVITRGPAESAEPGLPCRPLESCFSPQATAAAIATDGTQESSTPNALGGFVKQLLSDFLIGSSGSLLISTLCLEVSRTETLFKGTLSAPSLTSPT